MSTTTLRLCAMALLLPLAACVNMSGLSGGSKYACAAPEGVACDSVSGTYANALHENLPSQRTSGTAAGDAAAPSRSAVPVAPAPARQPLAAHTAANALAVTGDAPALALHSQARVLRLWTKPWEDADGDLWDQGYVYVQVETGRWQIDHVRQHIRNQYAPLRPPPANPSPAPSSSGPAPTETDAPAPSEGAVQRPTSLNPFPSLSRPPAGLGTHPQ